MRPHRRPVVLEPGSSVVAAPSLLHDDRFTSLADSLQQARGLRARATRLFTLARIRAVGGPAGGALAPVLDELPRWQVELPDTEAGHRMVAKYRGRVRGVPRQVAVSILALPDEPVSYLRGRSRQAVRTNSGRARADGITCRSLDLGEALRRLDTVVPDRWHAAIVPAAHRELHRGLTTGWVAQAPDGSTEALALTSAAGPLARLDLMLGHPERENSDARYLLSAHLITELARSGARLLTVDTALLVSPGLRYFQHLLGFGQATLTVQARHRRAPADTATQVP